MDQDLIDFKDAIKIVLEKEHGLNIAVEGTVYIRSLEGEELCVGEYDNKGEIINEESFINRFDDAFSKFIELKGKHNVGYL